FEVNDLVEGRGIIAFESSPKPHDPRVFWGQSGLGMIDGHTHLAFEPPEKKGLDVSRLHNFLKKYEVPTYPLNPFYRMQAPFAELAKASNNLRQILINLKKLLSPIEIANKALKTM